MGIFSSSIDLNKAEAPRGGGFYYTDGSYESEITAVKIIQTRSKGPMFLVETKVLESTNPSIPAGSRPSIAQMLQGDAADVAPQNIKMFMCAAAGLDIFSQNDAKAIAGQNWTLFGDSALADDQPLVGFRIAIEAATTESKKKKNQDGTPKQFTKMKFTPAKSLTADQVAMAKEARK